MAKRVRSLEPDREQAILSEIVEMYIENDGVMPSSRQIKKNRYISEEEVEILRRNGVLQEWRIRKLAEEKTGKKFLSSNERRRKQQHEEAQKRAVQKEEVMEEKAKKNATDEKKDGRKRKTKEQYLEELKRLCQEVGHVPTQAQIIEAAEQGKISRYATLQRQLGPWFMWGETLQASFKDEKIAQRAAEKRAAYLENFVERKNAQKRFEEKVAKGEVEPSETVDVTLSEEQRIQEEQFERFMAGKEAALAQEPSVEEAPEVVSEEIAPEEASSEEENSASEEVREIPFKLIIPAWVHGTVSIHLNV